MNMVKQVIDNRREELGLSERALSRASGVAESTLNRNLKTPGKLRLGQVVAIADALGLTAAEFFDRAEVAGPLATTIRK